MMRFGVIGAGGVGGYFGGLLARSGQDVTFVVHRATADVLRERPLEIHSVESGDFAVKVNATDDPAQVGPVDVVLVCVKTYDTASAIKEVAPMLGPRTLAISLQNGLAGAEELVRIAGRERVIGGVVYINAWLEAPGRVAHRSCVSRMVIGELGSGETDRVRALHEVLVKAGVHAEVSPDIMVTIWEKFAIICAFSGVLTLTRQPIGPVLADPESRLLMRRTIDEVVAIGRHRGVQLAQDLADKQLAYLDTFEHHSRSSMDGDLEAGHRLELEALNGAIVKMGRDAGIETPTNLAIYAALRPYLNGRPVARSA